MFLFVKTEDVFGCDNIGNGELISIPVIKLLISFIVLLMFSIKAFVSLLFLMAEC